MSPLAYFIVTIVLLGLGVSMGWACATASRRRPSEDDSLIRRSLGFVRQLAAGVSHDVQDHSRKLVSIAEQLRSAGLIAEAAENTNLLETISELLEVNDALHARMGGFERELNQHASELEKRMAETRLDTLTELTNRRGFDEELTRRVAEWRRTGTAFSIVLIDIDNFDEFNNSFGRQAGDFMLREIAELLRTTVREMDLVARMGSNCFATLLPATDLENAARVGGRLRQMIDGINCPFQGRTLKATVSAGVAETSRGDNVRTLIQRAESALAAAKQAGGNSAFVNDGTTSRPVGALPVFAELANDEGEGAERRKNRASQRPTDGQDDSARLDALTGLLNRRVFADELWRRIDSARERGQPLSLLLIGVDHLDTLNAFQGQQAVDRAMRKVAQVLSAVVRDADLVTRYGWEDFAVILSGTDLAEATAANARVRAALAACTLKLDHTTELTVSTGIAELASDDDPLSLAKRADAALHHSKAAGGNSTHACPGTGASIALLDAPTCEPVAG